MDGLSIHLELPDLWQQDAVRALKASKDVVLDAPTGAGKTFVFELLVKSGHLKGQAVYTVPTRALANDKWREWTQKGWDVGIATGDLAVNVDAPVVVATLETQRERFISGNGPRLLVIDEYQMIGDRRRGLNYELAVALAPPQTQLLLLSGSVANPQDIVSWMERLGRDAELIQTKVRPVPLDDTPIYTLPQVSQKAVKNFWARLAVQVLMADYAPLLIFAPQRKGAEKIAQKISEGLPPGQPVPLTQQQEHVLGPKLAKMVRNRVAYHHSGLSYAQRAGVIEPLAKAGHLRVIVATTGLAAGINFSVRSVLVAETQYFEGPFQREIAPDELLQMFGRAGRRGLDERGYVLSSDSSPRLEDGRPKLLRRNNEIDWPTLLRVMGEASHHGESPFEAARQVCERLYSRQSIRLGFETPEEERALPPHQPKHRDDALFGLGPMRREIRNSQRAWEREDPHGRGEVALKDVLVFNGKKAGWKPALESNDFMRNRVSNLGRVCKLSTGAPVIYGAEMAVANLRGENQMLLTKRLRSLTKTPKNRAETSPDNLQALIQSIVREQEPGAEVLSIENRNDLVYAVIDYSDVAVEAYKDSLGNWLVEPKRRTVNVTFDTSYVDSETGEMRNPAANSAAYAWRKLGLIDPDGTPTLRGQVFSFFQYGEGLPVAAALEDETYPIEDLVMHLANVRAGHRFEGDGMVEGTSERLAMICRQTYGPVDFEGYLRLGLPPGYGEGAAEVIEERLAGRSRRLSADNAAEFGEGDIERALLEWLSLLRHIRNAPSLDYARWQELQAIAAQKLIRYEDFSGSPLTIPVFEAHILHQTINHKLSLREATRF